MGGSGGLKLNVFRNVICSSNSAEKLNCNFIAITIARAKNLIYKETDSLFSIFFLAKMTCLISVPASLKLFLMLLNGTQNKEIIRNFTSHIIVHILFGIWQPFLVFTGYIVTHLYRDILSREIFIRGTYVQHALLCNPFNTLIVKKVIILKILVNKLLLLLLLLLLLPKG